MTIEGFKKVLESNNYSYKEERNKIIVNYRSDVHLESLTTLPEGIVFSNQYDVYLRALITLPEGTVFSNGGYVYLESLTTLPEGIVFSNGGNVDLESLTTLPEGTVFSNRGDVYLPSLFGGLASDWKGNIRGIDSKRLLNKMISLGLFDRK